MFRYGDILVYSDNRPYQIYYKVMGRTKTHYRLSYKDHKGKRSFMDWVIHGAHTTFRRV